MSRVSWVLLLRESAAAHEHLPLQELQVRRTGDLCGERRGIGDRRILGEASLQRLRAHAGVAHGKREVGAGERDFPSSPFDLGRRAVEPDGGPRLLDRGDRAGAHLLRDGVGEGARQRQGLFRQREGLLGGEDREVRFAHLVADLEAHARPLARPPTPGPRGRWRPARRACRRARAGRSSRLWTPRERSGSRGPAPPPVLSPPGGSSPRRPGSRGGWRRSRTGLSAARARASSRLSPRAEAAGSSASAQMPPATENLDKRIQLSLHLVFVVWTKQAPPGAGTTSRGATGSDSEDGGARERLKRGVAALECRGYGKGVFLVMRAAFAARSDCAAANAWRFRSGRLQLADESSGTRTSMQLPQTGFMPLSGACSWHGPAGTAAEGEHSPPTSRQSAWVAPMVEREQAPEHEDGTHPGTGNAASGRKPYSLCPEHGR